MNFFDSAVFRENRLENIYDCNSLRKEFPARLNREAIRDNRGSILRYQGTNR
jgi:hypothetical protein